MTAELDRLKEFVISCQMRNLPVEIRKAWHKADLK